MSTREQRRARFDAWYERQKASNRPTLPRSSNSKQRLREGAGTAGVKGATTHGTAAGYYWHKSRGDLVEDMRACGCAEAGRVYRAGIRRRRAERELREASCGTFSGYRRHRANGVDIESLNAICPACYDVYVARFKRKRPMGVPGR
jgi:hypothetical protein